MDTFDFPFHTFSTKYPDPSNRVQLGRSYMYTPRPDGPDARLFTLNFKTMCFYENADGTIDKTTNPQMNAGVLEDFYNAHQLWSPFTYNHPTLGPITVKFNKPLELPAGMEGGNGWLSGFTIELLEQP